jgi:hypothetical protein
MPILALSKLIMYKGSCRGMNGAEELLLVVGEPQYGRRLAPGPMKFMMTAKIMIPALISALSRKT